jgi:hypothetical protein
MGQDLQDLLALWLGDHDPGEARRTGLISRLHDDNLFRRAFVEELSLLGMLKAVQSSEPRWLRLEDEIGWSARQHDDVETLARKVVQTERRRRRNRRLAGWCVATAAAVLAGFVLFWAFGPGNAPPGTPPESLHEAINVATAIKAEDVQWEPGDGTTPDAGSVVALGRLRFRSGRLTLAFFSGASLSVEGPADLELLAADRVFCHRGKLRAHVPRGAEGFTILGAGYEVVDLGTEFALNLAEPGGKPVMMIFQGEAAVSVLGKDGRSVRGALLEGRRSVEVDPIAGHIQEIPPLPEAFVPLSVFVPASLELPPGYPAEIMSAKPWGYWRFESLLDGRVPNEVPGRPALHALGAITLEESPGGNRCARFSYGDHTQAFLMDGEWTPNRTDGYAIEAWVQADLPSPQAFGQTALVGLIDCEEGQDEKHLAYLELTARGRRSPHEPCAVRFLDRWPADVTGGTDLFSRRTFVPSLWHHVVAQKSGDTLELYVDGERVSTSPVKLNTQDSGDASTTGPCRLLVGRLKRRSTPPHIDEIRAFEGRLDELAVYNRPLTPDEIRQHVRLRAPATSP